MNQTTDLVDVEALRLLLEEEGKYYGNAGFQKFEEARERLLHTLQTNDCREIITAVVDDNVLVNAFLVAGYRGHHDVLEAFSDHGMNIDIKDKSGWTALIGASHYGQEECVQFLLDHNANVDVQDNFGETALIRAAHIDKIRIVEMLLEKNANPDLQDKFGRTALMRSCSCGGKDIAQLLMKHGADIDLKNNVGRTALDLAEDEEIKEMIRNHVNNNYVLK